MWGTTRSQEATSCSERVTEPWGRIHNGQGHRGLNLISLHSVPFGAHVAPVSQNLGRGQLRSLWVGDSFPVEGVPSRKDNEMRQCMVSAGHSLSAPTLTISLFSRDPGAWSFPVEAEVRWPQDSVGPCGSGFSAALLFPGPAYQTPASGLSCCGPRA